MLIGEKVICIDENPMWIMDIVELSGNGITLGKEYVIERTYSNGKVAVVNDCNCLTVCEERLFGSLAEFRKMKINKICSRLEIK